MIKLDYISFLGHTGYGVAGKNTILALSHTNLYDIKVTPLDFDLKSQSLLFKDFARKKNDVNRIQIFHCIPDMIRRFPRNLKSIGVGVFETWEPPAHWIAILNKNDALIVPSQFNQQIFQEAGITKPIFHIPHCLDMQLYSPNVAPMHTFDKFTFLFLGSWRLRKGYKELLDAWQEEFILEDPVQLVIKTDKPQVAQEEIHRMVKTCAPVTVESSKYPDEQMPAFIKSFHCLVSPHRGEGFGLPGLSAMAVGVPVIITNHSGCQEYANSETATLLEPEEIRLEKCLDGIPQFSRKRWVYVSSHQIAKTMRYVFTHQAEIKTKAQAAYLYVCNRFGYNALADRFQQMIHKIL